MTRRSPVLSVRGFTLLELLAAVGIIALLAALLLAGMNSVRAGSEQAKCAGNLRALGAAIHTYAADHDGFLPLGSRKGHLGFVASLVPYLSPMKGTRIAPDVFYCPTNVRLGSPPAGGYPENPPNKGWSGYTLNYYFNGSVFPVSSDVVGTPSYRSEDQSRLKMLHFSKPSRTLALHDSITRVPFYSGPPTATYIGRKYFDPENSAYNFGHPHKSSCNVLLLDGHVESFLKKAPLPLISLPDHHISYPPGGFWWPE